MSNKCDRLNASCDLDRKGILASAVADAVKHVTFDELQVFVEKKLQGFDMKKSFFCMIFYEISFITQKIVESCLSMHK